MKIVVVEWLDAQDHSDKWADFDDVEEWSRQECVITSVGFLVSEGPKYITIAGDWDKTDKDWGRVTKIPRGMVVSIYEPNVSKSPVSD